MSEPRTPWTAFDYAVVDVEGNGQQPPDLVEIAIVPVENGIIGAPRSWLVKPPRPITPIARRIHRISDYEIVDAPSTAQIAGELHAALNGMVFVAHNAGVDLGVLSRELPGFQPTQVLDTLKLARRVLPGRDSYKLGALVAGFGLAKGLPNGLAPHRATYDATVCARLLAHMASPADRNQLTLTDLLNLTHSKTDAAADEPAATLF